MWKDILRGIVAGLGATVPMTLAMEAGWRWLPRREQYSLPPRQITEEVTHQVGLDDQLNQEEMRWATGAAHLGYGAAMGGLYTFCVRPWLAEGKTRNLAAGIGWGLTVWTGSYLGLLPGLGILSPATRHSARRNALMIGAHIIWGAALEECLAWQSAHHKRAPKRLTEAAPRTRHVDPVESDASTPS
jgi:hypothetical protein